MKQTIRVSIILALFLLSSSVWAQSPQPGTVTLTLDEYQALQKAAQVAKPPKDFILSQAEYRVTPGENTLAVKARLTAVVYVEGPVLVPLFGEGVRIDKATVDGKPAVLTAEDNGGVTWALLGKPGDEMTLEMEFHTELREERGFFNADFTIPRAGVARLEVDYPYKEVRALLGKKAWPTTRDNRGHSILSASIGGWEKVQLSWLPLSDDAKLRLHVEELIAVEHRELGVDYNLTLRLYVSGRPLQELVLPFEKGLALNSVQGEKVARYETQDEKATIRFSEALYGNHQVNLTFHRHIGDATHHELFLPRFVPEKATSFGGIVAITKQDLYQLTVKTQENIRPIAVDQVSDRKIAWQTALAFRLLQREYGLTYHLEKIPSEFNAALYSNISFGETTCILNTRCECVVDQGTIHAFQFSIPDNFQTESVGGAQIRSWAPTPDGKYLEVVLDEAVRGKTIFSIQLRKNYEDQEEIPVHLPEIAGPKRVRGFLTIAPQSNVRVSVSEENNLEWLAADEIPLSMLSSGGGAPPYAFRYLEQPAGLTLTTERLQKAVLETSVIKKMHVSLDFTAQGIITIELIVGLINADTNLLQVDIGTGTTLRLCTVNGGVVDPALGDTSGTLLIPIPKSRSTESTLHLSYLLDGQPVQDGLRLDLPLPRIELPIDEMGIMLCPPPQYSVELQKPGLFQVAKAPRSIQLTRKDIKYKWVQGNAGPIPPDAPPRMRELMKALETYYIDNNSYAPDFPNLTTPIVHLPPGDSFWKDWQYKTDYLATYHIGYPQVASTGESYSVQADRGVYYQAAMLRGTPEQIKQHLQLLARFEEDKAWWKFW